VPRDIVHFLVPELARTAEVEAGNPRDPDKHSLDAFAGLSRNGDLFKLAAHETARIIRSNGGHFLIVSLWG
jgi:hypothetical protein